MRFPDSPYLELGFYFESLGRREAFQRVIGALEVSEGLLIHSAKWSPPETTSEIDTRDKFPPELTERPVVELEEIHSLSTEIDGELCKLKTSGLINIVPERYEFVVAGQNSAGHLEHGTVISIWSDGSWLSTGSSAVSQSQRKCGAKALHVFRTLLGLLDPTYAAITVDYGLETPEALRTDPRSHAFRDFYLSQRFLSPSIARKFSNEYKGFYQESVGKGRLFLSSGFLLAERGPVEPLIAYETSGFIAKTIAHSWGE